MISSFTHISRRLMSVVPTSNFITLPNRPIVQSNGETVQGPLKLHYWEWKGHQPTILFCHGASFHGRCYDRIINEALQGFHVITLDLRSHGRSQAHPPPHHFRWFGEDVLEFIETLNLPKDNLIGIGHSTGGYSLIWAAAKASRQLFRSLLLFDPVIYSPSHYGNPDSLQLVSAHNVLRRKSQWSSIDEMISRLEKRGAFFRWPKDILRNYCTYAVDENCTLVCTPHTEASIYVSSAESDSNLYPLIEQSKFIQEIPIHIVRTFVESLKDIEASPTGANLFKWFKKGRDTHLKNSKHLFPMEDPQVAIDLIQEIMKEQRRSNL